MANILKHLSNNRPPLSPTIFPIQSGEVGVFSALLFTRGLRPSLPWGAGGSVKSVPPSSSLAYVGVSKSSPCPGFKSKLCKNHVSTLLLLEGVNIAISPLKNLLSVRIFFWHLPIGYCLLWTCKSQGPNKGLNPPFRNLVLKICLVSEMSEDSRSF